MRISTILQRIIFGITALPLFCLLTGCYLTFFKTNTQPSIANDELNQLNNINKYIIIHFQNDIRALKDAYVSGDSLYGNIVPLPDEHSKYLHPPASSNKNRVKHKHKDVTLTEVHLYTNALRDTTDSVFVSKISSFNRADVYELNKGATNANHIISSVGIAVGAVALISAIVIGSSGSKNNSSDTCNCPQLYMENNGTYSFTSGLYSGAVYSPLERTDYLPLKNTAINNDTLSFKISNANNEEQFINNVSLLQVIHSSNSSVLPDRHGAFYSYNSLQPPVHVGADKNNNIQNALQRTDEQYYSFDNTANSNGFSDVTLDFKKPPTTQAKLVIHARNSFWGGLLHKEMLHYFGDNFEKWRAKQEKEDSKQLEKWLTDQALPLMVYVKQGNEWKFVDYFPMIGNTASRDMIMQIDTKNITGDKLQIKLETAYRFWDLDFAAMDYSENENFTVNNIQPQLAVKSNDADQKEALQRSDKIYTHLTDSDYISFRYYIPLAENNSSSLFLVSGGYYHTLEQITGKTNYSALYKLQKAGGFDKFSREKYKEAVELTALLNDK